MTSVLSFRWICLILKGRLKDDILASHWTFPAGMQNPGGVRFRLQPGPVLSPASQGSTAGAVLSAP